MIKILTSVCDREDTVLCGKKLLIYQCMSGTCYVQGLIRGQTPSISWL